MDMLKLKHVQSSRDTSVGMWVQEIGALSHLSRFPPLFIVVCFVAWRDFYTHVMCAWPRVSMGRPYQEKYADVKWELNEEHFNAWKEGKTGVPIVDAGMRQLNSMGEAVGLVFGPRGLVRTMWNLGWMHNRVRMIVAMYLTKDLMLDWHLGERVRDPSLLVSRITGVHETYAHV